MHLFSLASIFFSTFQILPPWSIFALIYSRTSFILFLLLSSFLFFIFINSLTYFILFFIHIFLYFCDLRFYSFLSSFIPLLYLPSSYCTCVYCTLGLLLSLSFHQCLFVLQNISSEKWRFDLFKDSSVCYHIRFFPFHRLHVL